MENVHLFREIDNAKDDMVRAIDNAIEEIERLEARIKDLEMDLRATEELSEKLQDEVEELKNQLNS